MNGGGEQKLLFPSLAGFYSCFSEIAYALVRVITGYNVFMHGYGKVSDFAGVSAYMTKVSLVPAAFFAGANIFLETVGAVCIIVGLFTRFFAAALAIELGIAFLVVHLSRGFSVGKGGYEYVLLLGIVMLAIAIRGGGRYSLDRLVGKEL